MSINPQDVKLYESQRLTDEYDGGGRATGNEIIDGNINNLFPDISRLDRTIGDVALRKAFVGIDTGNADVYLGAHAIIVEPPADPLVNVVIFDAGTESDNRMVAQNRIESYVVKGAMAQFELIGNQYENQRQIVCIQRLEIGIPATGEVYLLSEGLNEQYIRVTDVEDEEAVYAYEVNNTFIEFNRRRIVLSISAPLKVTFPGGQPTPAGTTSPKSAVFTTEVADAARYWGSKRSTGGAAPGDVSVQVASLYASLVPSSQTEQPIIDRPIGHPVAQVRKAAAVDFTDSVVGQYSSTTQVQLFLKRACKPASLILTLGGSLYTDIGTGTLARSSGSFPFATLTIDYEAGHIFGTRDSGTGSGTVAGSAIYMPAAPNTGRSQSFSTGITISNRGYNFVQPFAAVKPLPRTMTVAYMALGKWYELRDNGAGQLIGAGSGSVSYATGTVAITLLALPDVGSSIIYSFIMDLAGEFTIRTGTLATEIPQVKIQLSGGVAPGTVNITYLVGGVTKTLTDNGAGVLSGTGGTGTVLYTEGLVTIKPNFLHDDGSNFNATYQNGAVLTQSAAQGFSGALSGTMGPGAIMPGSIWLKAHIYREGVFNRYLTVRDNGSGGWQGASGSINYATGAWTLNYTVAVPYTVQAYYEHKATFWAEPTKIYYNATKYYQDQARGYDIAFRTAGNPALAAPPVSYNPNELILNLIPTGDDPLIAGSLMFTFAGQTYIDKNGILYKNHDSKTGAATAVGSVNYSDRTAILESWPAGAAPGVVIISALTANAKVFSSSFTLRTPSAPVRPESVTVTATDIDGNIISATADANGIFSGPKITGQINYETGVIYVYFTTNPLDANAAVLVQPDGKYNAVLFSFLPLDAELIGLDPVRLPGDGKVPIFREGDVIVMSHTIITGIGTPVSNQTVILSRDMQASIKVYDSLDKALDPAMYTVNREAGTVHFKTTGLVLQDAATNPLTPPLKIKDRIEHMSVLNDIEITGKLSFIAPLAHDYPANETIVSSALLWGDLNSRVWAEFTQKTWNSGTPNWTNARIGDDTTAQYNNIDNPIEYANNGAVTEKWALWFYSSSAFYIVGEQLGIIGQGNITTDCVPINSNTGNPYFIVRSAGWGIGWATNNVMRFNTDGCLGPMWLARTVLSGAATQENDQFTLQVRGDAD